MGRFALLIGNSEYRDGRLPKLALPEADVSSLEQVLTDKSIGAFDEVKLLINPCWHEVQPAITKFFRNHDRDDFLVVFFAGHGVKDRDGHLYLTFKDTDLDNLEGSAIPDSFVAKNMDHSRAESQLLILDCCYSGAFGRDARAGLGTPVGIREVYSSVLDDVRSTGRMILTATDAIQFALEGNEVRGIASTWRTTTNSIFTHALIQGLREGEADLDGNGEITVDELYQYVLRKVRSINPHQEPQLLTRSGKHWGNLVIARNPKLVSLQTGDEPLESVHNALRSDHPSIPHSATAELKRLSEENLASAEPPSVSQSSERVSGLPLLKGQRKASAIKIAIVVPTLILVIVLTFSVHSFSAGQPTTTPPGTSTRIIQSSPPTIGRMFCSPSNQPAFKVYLSVYTGLQSSDVKKIPYGLGMARIPATPAGSDGGSDCSYQLYSKGADSGNYYRIEVTLLHPSLTLQDFFQLWSNLDNKTYPLELNSTNGWRAWIDGSLKDNLNFQSIPLDKCILIILAHQSSDLPPDAGPKPSCQ